MLTSPYNFVPLNREVFFPDWAKQVSMDIPFADGEDGIIKIDIKNESPLYIRNGHLSDNDPDRDFSCHILTEKSGERLYFIPGSSLKGAIRNVMEVLSFAQMNRYDNDSFGMSRGFNKRLPDNEKYMKLMADGAVLCGWLRKDGNERYWLKPCGKPVKIHHDQIRSHFPKFYAGKNQESAERKQKSVFEDDDYAVLKIGKGEEYIPEGAYKLVCTGYMYKKEHEYLFPETQNEELPVDDLVIEQFISIHRHTEYFGGKKGDDGFLYRRLENGLQIPVFYHMGMDETTRVNKVKSMGLARMYRFPVSNSVKQAVEHTQPFVSGIDLPSLIFGFSDGDDAFRGRVHVGHAFADCAITDDLCRNEQIRCVLGEPRASFYPLYLKRNGDNTCNSYDKEKVEIAGRKRYRIHPSSYVIRENLPVGNGNENVMTTMCPIPAGQTFCCNIAVHNLRKVEIGALISAITFNDTEGTFHNLGMGKSIGLGKCRINVIGMLGLAFSVEDYLKAFETEIFNFLYANKMGSLSQNESLKTLVAIASDNHKEEDMKIMSELKNYEDTKKSTETLSEQLRDINVHIDEKQIVEEIKISKYVPEIEAIVNDQGMDIKAKITAMKTLEGKMRAEGLPTTIAEEARKRILEHAKTVSEVTGPDTNQSLASFLESSALTSPGQFSGRIKVWLKNDNNHIGPDERHVIAEKWAVLLKNTVKKQKELNLWLNDLKKWKDLIKVVGDAETQKIMNMVKKQITI